MKFIETHPREKGFALKGHCKTLLDYPRIAKMDKNLGRYDVIKQVCMTRKCYNHRAQTHPQHHEEETHSTKSLSLSLSQRDDAKTRKDTKYIQFTEQGPKQ